MTIKESQPGFCLRPGRGAVERAEGGQLAAGERHQQVIAKPDQSAGRLLLVGGVIDEIATDISNVKHFFVCF